VVVVKEMPLPLLKQVVTGVQDLLQLDMLILLRWQHLQLEVQQLQQLVVLEFINGLAQVVSPSN
jgi:hypothetical protein